MKEEIIKFKRVLNEKLKETKRFARIAYVHNTSIIGLHRLVFLMTDSGHQKPKCCLQAVTNHFTIHRRK